MSWKQKVSKGGGGDYERPPAGNHLARLIGMFDLGIQETEFNGVQKDQHRVYWVWELLNEKQGGTKNVNHVIGLDLTFSLNEKAKMRKMIESRLARQIPDGTEYDIIEELGQPCLLNVVMNGEYTKVDGMSAVPKGMTAPPAQRTPVALQWSEIMAGKQIPDWAPYIYGESPLDVAKRGTDPDGPGQSRSKKEVEKQQESPAQQSSEPPRNGPPPRQKIEPKFYIDTLSEADPVLLPLGRIKELVSEQGKAAFDWKACPEGGDKWELLAEAIPDSVNWAPF